MKITLFKAELADMNNPFWAKNNNEITIEINNDPFLKAPIHRASIVNNNELQ